MANVRNLGHRNEPPKMLKGRTLAEINRDRKKNGLVDPNDKSKKFYGVTSITIGVHPVNPRVIPGNNMVHPRGCTDNADFESCEATVSTSTKICKPSDYNKLSKNAKKEWDRFEKALIKHEQVHVADGLKLAQKFCDEVTAMTAKGKGGSMEEAAADALKNLNDALQKEYNSKAIELKVNAVLKARDVHTKHGRDVKAVLKTDVK